MVARALRIMETLDSSRRGLNISEISRKLDIPKSSTHVVILTLEELDYVNKAPSTRRYSLGLKAYGLGQRMMKSFSMAEVARPVMQKLVDSTDLTSHLAVLDKGQAVCIQKVEPAQFDPVRHKDRSQKGSSLQRRRKGNSCPQRGRSAARFPIQEGLYSAHAQDDQFVASPGAGDHEDSPAAIRAG